MYRNEHSKRSKPINTHTSPEPDHVHVKASSADDQKKQRQPLQTSEINKKLDKIISNQQNSDKNSKWYFIIGIFVTIVTFSGISYLYEKVQHSIEPNTDYLNYMITDSFSPEELLRYETLSILSKNNDGLIMKREFNKFVHRELRGKIETANPDVAICGYSLQIAHLKSHPRSQSVENAMKGIYNSKTPQPDRRKYSYVYKWVNAEFYRVTEDYRTAKNIYLSMLSDTSSSDRLLIDIEKNEIVSLSKLLPERLNSVTVDDFKKNGSIKLFNGSVSRNDESINATINLITTRKFSDVQSVPGSFGTNANMIIYYRSNPQNPSGETGMSYDDDPNKVVCEYIQHQVLSPGQNAQCKPMGINNTSFNSMNIAISVPRAYIIPNS